MSEKTKNGKANVCSDCVHGALPANFNPCDVCITLDRGKADHFSSVSVQDAEQRGYDGLLHPPAESFAPSPLERIAAALEKLANRRPNPRLLVLPTANGTMTREDGERMAEVLRDAFEGKDACSGCGPRKFNEAAREHVGPLLDAYDQLNRDEQDWPEFEVLHARIEALRESVDVDHCPDDCPSLHPPDDDCLGCPPHPRAIPPDKPTRAAYNCTRCDTWWHWTGAEWTTSPTMKEE